MDSLEVLGNLMKALESGNYNAAPSTLTQFGALQVEDLSNVIELTTATEKSLKLSKSIKSESCKSNLAQFDRQLSYGMFGGSAQLEGAVGQEETSDYVRAVVPMKYYAHLRRVTLVANLIKTVDGKKAEDRAAEDAAKKVAMDIEFDCFRGLADFSNSGVFDGNPDSIPVLPNIKGLDVQIRESDGMIQAKDLMFGEFGSDLSVVISGGGFLTQTLIEDAKLRSSLAFGEADVLYVDPMVKSAYNINTYAAVSGGLSTAQRVIIGNAMPSASGADLGKQWTADGGEVKVESSQFLRGKFKPQAFRVTSPTAPVSAVATAATPSPVTSLEAGEYRYGVTSVNELGESSMTYATETGSGDPTVTVTLGQKVTLAIVAPASPSVVKYFNVYRSFKNASSSTTDLRLIGRIKNTGFSATVSFVDLNNKTPGFVTGYLLQSDTYGFKELLGYSRAKMAKADLSETEAHFNFKTLAVFQPRKNVLIDNLKGSVQFYPASA